jgi:N-acetylglucosaminyldiphosphoundecaprenol N-acetyl-beta-D-mannosaminyltransferase
MSDVTDMLRADAAETKVLGGTESMHASIASGSRIVTVNVYHQVLFERDPAFAESLTAADCWTADGWPVQLLWRLAGIRVDRVTGSGLCQALVEEDLAAVPARRIAMIGGTADSGDRFSELLERSGRTLVFRQHGDRASWDARQMAASIDTAGSELVLVAVTSPFCELFAADLQRYLSCAIVGVGGGVDMVTGSQRLAPRVVVDARMEWLWRLAHDPRRLWRRYVLECLPFLVFRAPRALIAARRIRSSPGLEP